MLTSDFDYSLPQSAIAQKPAEPRDSCRLLVMDRASGALQHRRFRDLKSILVAGDLLVINETRVMPARLIGHRGGGSARAEVLLLRKLNDSGEDWEALVYPGKKLKPGAFVMVDNLRIDIRDWAPGEMRGGRLVHIAASRGESVDAALHRLGRLPLPPYIKAYAGDDELYQTVYAKRECSAAAPTAGLHFSTELLDELQNQGVKVATLDLEVGIDTFRTMEEENVSDHVIHSEYYTIPTNTVEQISQTRQTGGRVIAVGTTSVRSLESAWDEKAASLRTVWHEQTSLFITPGYKFNVVDAIITNFHVPKSTLILLICAFANRENIMRAYSEALSYGYRFLSFGDAMLIQ